MSIFFTECYIIDLVVDGYYELAKSRYKKYLVFDTLKFYNFCLKHKYLTKNTPYNIFIQMLKFNNYDLSINEHKMRIKIVY